MIGTRRLSAARRARRKLVEGPGSLGTRFRARRWQLFVSLFPELRDMHVIDLGGRPDTWRWAGQPARRVTIVNLEPITHVPEPWIDTVQGDACELPKEVADASWDLVYSNSLLEHVGGHYRRMQLAENIEQLASRHWVQTPYRYFPVEPHWLPDAPVPAARCPSSNPHRMAVRAFGSQRLRDLLASCRASGTADPR